MRYTSTLFLSCAFVLAGSLTGHAEPDVRDRASQEALVAGFAPICLGGGDGSLPCSFRDSIPSTCAWLDHPRGSLIERFACGKNDRRAYYCLSGERPTVVRGSIRELYNMTQNTYDLLATAEARKEVKTVLKPSWVISCKEAVGAAKPAAVLPVIRAEPGKPSVHSPPAAVVPPAAVPPASIAKPEQPAASAPVVAQPPHLPAAPSRVPDMGTTVDDVDRAIDEMLKQHPNL